MVGLTTLDRPTESPSGEVWPRIRITAAGRALGYVITFLVPATLAYFYVINLFYNRGAWAWDAGWFAGLIGHPSWTLPNSATIDIFHLGSWYDYHISPLLAVVSWVGALLPFQGPSLLALLLGSFEGVLGLTVYAALRSLGERSTRLSLIAIPVAILASLGGPELATLAFPHIEGAIPIFALAFITLRALGYKFGALAAFIACLLMREDAGLHLALLLGAVAVAKILTVKSLKVVRDEAVFILVAVSYAILAAAAQRLFTHGGHLFEIMFSGEPPYAHLTRQRLFTIAAAFVKDRGYIYWPLIITVAAAIWTRSWLLLAGFLSSIPWMIVCFTSLADQIAKITGYYGFPLIFGSCWPVVAALLERRLRPIQPWRSVVIQLAVTLSSIVSFPGHRGMDGPEPWTLFHPLPQDVSVRKTDSLIHWIGTARPRLGRIVAGDAVVALDTSAFSESEWYKWDDEWSAQRFDSIDTLIFFKSERLAAALSKFVAIDPEVTILQVAHTNIIIATRRSLATVGAPADMVTRPCVKLPATIRPTIDAKPYDAWQFGGWSGPEETGRWTEGDRSSLHLQLCEAPSNGLRLDLDAQAFLAAGHPDEDVELVANGHPVARWHFQIDGGDQTAPVLIPPDTLDHAEPNLQLTFRIANPASPVSIGMSADRRKLGLFVKKLTIQAE